MCNFLIALVAITVSTVVETTNAENAKVEINLHEALISCFYALQLSSQLTGTKVEKDNSVTVCDCLKIYTHPYKKTH